MASTDHMGRPVVVVTGMGVVTSLGAGREDNWRKAHRGRVRYPRDHALFDRGFEDPHRRHRRLRSARSVFLARRSPSGSPRWPPRKPSRNPVSAAAAISPDRCSLRSRRSRSSGTQREELVRASGANDGLGYPDLWRAGETSDFRSLYERFLFGSVAGHIADRFGTKGSPISLSTACASGASAIQLGVEAIRRGETSAALCIGTDGSVNAEVADPLLAPVRALDQQRSAARGRAPVLQESRRIRHGGRRRRAGAGKPGGRAGARRENPRRASKAAARWPTASTARVRARTASRSSAACATR